MSELDFIQSMRLSLPSHPLVVKGPGDDCAVLQSHPLQQLVTMDSLMDGSHFIVGQSPPKGIGHKSLGVSLSDIAAMGGVPETAFLSLAIPKGFPSPDLDDILQGILDLAERFQVALAGGDTNSWAGPLVISMLVTGRPHRKGPVGRDGAKVGDIIFVTGPLGGSLVSHHLCFEPRLSLVKEVLDRVDIHGMVDISDGLATDLRHICIESQVAASLDPSKIPIRNTLSTLDPQEQIQRALADGEDFELCFTVSEANARLLQENQTLNSTLVPIGRIVDAESHLLSWQDGTPITAKGYEHQF